MAEFFRPSDGKSTGQRFLDMNVRGYLPGEEVVYRSTLTGIVAGRIDRRLSDQEFEIGIECVKIPRILGRIPPGTERATVERILEQLNAAEDLRDRVRREAWDKCAEDQARILREHSVR